MTAAASSYSGAPARHSGTGRVLVAVLGAAAVLVGLFLLFNPFAAARTLALLFGLAMVISGALELAVGWDSDRRGPSIALGAVLIIGGILAAVWPGVTLWTLALIVGLSLILHGGARLFLAFSADGPRGERGLLALVGAFNILVGILALVWPEATVLVLSLIFGAQVLVFGILVVVAALWRPKAEAPTPL
jgi:uncharacterized membrane protein HdeD (DUF308 family)